MNTESCNCRAVAEGRWHDAGDFFFRGDGLYIVLPDGCMIVLNISLGGERLPTHTNVRPVWTWDGNREKPTLTPSIHTIDHWHGYLTAGRLISC